jgi:D-alanyl-D-alanine carboxypeptidase (penicillin-binding protein 5/6)
MTRVWFTALCVLACGAAHAGEGALPAPPKVAFRSYYVTDFATSSVIASNAADEPVAPASLTKLMTAYVVFEALADGKIKLEDMAPVSIKAWRTGGTRMFIDVNSQVAVADLVRGMLIQSGNDAAVALAEHVAGSEPAFVTLMNQRAAALGMKNSTWRNTTGLPARGHVTTAHDLAILAHAIIARFPQYYSIVSEREYTYNGITQHNRNALLWKDPRVDGMKTGHTQAAGYCIVTSARHDDMRLIAVVLGAETPKARNDGAEKLLEYGFANYETHKLYRAGEKLGVARVQGGAPEVAPLGLAADLYVTIPRGRYADLSASMSVAGGAIAPLERGTPVGEVKVALGGRPLSSAPLVALRQIPQGGVWTKIAAEIGGLLGEAEAAEP